MAIFGGRKSSAQNTERARRFRRALRKSPCDQLSAPPPAAARPVATMAPPLHLNAGVALGGDLLEDRVVDRCCRPCRHADKSNSGGNQRRNHDFAHSLLPLRSRIAARARQRSFLKRCEVNGESLHRLVSAANLSGSKPRGG